jgi:hypothetical protein
MSHRSGRTTTTWGSNRLLPGQRKDEHSFAGLQAGTIRARLPRGQGRQQKCRRFDMGETYGPETTPSWGNDTHTDVAPSWLKSISPYTRVPVDNELTPPPT